MKKEKEFGPAPAPTTRGTADIPGTTEKVTVMFYGKPSNDLQAQAVAIAKHRAAQLAPIPKREERVRVFVSRGYNALGEDLYDDPAVEHKQPRRFNRKERAA